MRSFPPADREPEVQLSHQMLGVYWGDDVHINCTVTAFPPPVVFWRDSHGKMIITGGEEGEGEDDHHRWGR